MAEKAAVNPFSFGDLALDDSFTDREQEVLELLERGATDREIGRASCRERV